MEGFGRIDLGEESLNSRRVVRGFSKIPSRQGVCLAIVRPRRSTITAIGVSQERTQRERPHFMFEMYELQAPMYHDLDEGFEAT